MENKVDKEAIFDVLNSIKDYFENKADADHDENGYIPNIEMRHSAELSLIIPQITQLQSSNEELVVRNEKLNEENNRLELDNGKLESENTHLRQRLEAADKIINMPLGICHPVVIDEQLKQEMKSALAEYNKLKNQTEGQ